MIRWPVMLNLFSYRAETYVATARSRCGHVTNAGRLNLCRKIWGRRAYFLLIIRDITDWEGGLERENCIAAQGTITACDVGSLAAFRR